MYDFMIIHFIYNSLVTFYVFFVFDISNLVLFSRNLSGCIALFRKKMDQENVSVYTFIYIDDFIDIRKH